MTHDELLIKSITSGDTSTSNALHAVVKLHKPGSYEYFPGDICETCTLDIDYFIIYPCPTIEAIEKELG